MSAPTEPPLLPLLRSLIAEQGPIPVASYMALALGHPRHGYYMTRDPFGARGDFITAPEITQLFGECLAIWCALVWDSMKRPLPVRLVELGPGRGTLMADLTRTLERIAPKLAAGATIHLVETSPVLRRAQEAALRGRNAAWHARFDEVPEGPLLLVANEFFDALPVHQFVKRGDVWCERRVGYDDAETSLRFVVDAKAAAPQSVPAFLSEAPDGSLFEMCPLGAAIAGAIGRRLARFGGAALLIDYGHTGAGFGETLQAVKAHRYADPLAEPGEADLTAHVDFSALAAAAQGAHTFGPLEQGEFLLRLGLAARAEALSRANSNAREAVRAAFHRLTAPEAMGTLFKVLALSSARETPPGFA